MSRRSAPYNRAERRSMSGNVPTYSLGPNPNLASPADQPGRWKHDKFDGRQPGGPSIGGTDAFGNRREEVDYGPDRSVAPTRKLVIEDLHYEVTTQELAKLFAEIGMVQSGPEILYDRSGRSRGIAYVTFVNIEDAITARAEFDGAKAKGQVIAVSFAREPRGGADFVGARGGFEGRRGGFGPGGARGRTPVGLSLADRINKGDLSSRLAPVDAPSGPSNGKSVASRPSARDRPMRSVSDGQSRGGGGGGGRGGGRRGAQKRGPKTVSDLDAELEAFMNAPPPTVGTGTHKAANEEAAKSVHAPKNADGDVEMEG